MTPKPTPKKFKFYLYSNFGRPFVLIFANSNWLSLNSIRCRLTYFTFSKFHSLSSGNHSGQSLVNKFVPDLLADLPSLRKNFYRPPLVLYKGVFPLILFFVLIAPNLLLLWTKVVEIIFKIHLSGYRAQMPFHQAICKATLWELIQICSRGSRRFWPVDNFFYRSRIFRLVQSFFTGPEFFYRSRMIIILTADTNCLRTNVRYVAKSEKVLMGC